MPRAYSLLPLLLSAACGSAFTAAGGDASTNDASVGDASVEASLDSPAFPDSPPTDGSGGEGGMGSPCGESHVFCDDFDHGPLSAKWKVDGPCAADNLDPSTWVSSPASMLAQPPSAGACQRMYVSLAAAQRLRCDFELDISLLPSKYVEVFRFAVTSQTVPYYQVAIGFDMTNPLPAVISEDASLVDGGNPNQGARFAFPMNQVGNWVHARLSLDLQGRSATAITGNTSQNLMLAFAPLDAAQSLQIRAGASGAGTGTIAVHFDNLYCDTF